MDLTSLIRLLIFFTSVPALLGAILNPGFSLLPTFSVCGQSRYDEPSGVLSSPRYPKLYQSNLQCKWLIDATPGYKLVINFIAFALESSDNCRNDFLNITNDKLVYPPYCGSVQPPRISPRSRTIEMKFVTNSAIERKGFQLTWDRVPLGRFTACGALHLTGSSGVLTTPDYSRSRYSNNFYCSWTIVPSPGKTLRIQFTNFDLESSSNDCIYDYVAIRIGQNKPSIYCGSTIPPSFETDQSNVTVQFFSDESITAKGFRLLWDTRTIQCPEYSMENGYINCTDGRNFHSLCIHRCIDGYRLEGNMFTRCEQDVDGNGIWNGPGSLSRCADEVAPAITRPETATEQTTDGVPCTVRRISNGMTICLNGGQIGSMCEHLCNLGYQQVGNFSSVCIRINSTFSQWSPPFPVCLGPPALSQNINFNPIPTGNKVTFHCSYLGVPAPELVWTFANGNRLPSSSQFQIGEEKRLSSFQTTRSLTVYGVSCKSTALLQYRCWGHNSQKRNPKQNTVFVAGLNKSSLRFSSEQVSCAEAISFCKGLGGSLAILPSRSSIRAVGRDKITTFWVSSLTRNYFNSTDPEIALNPDGCLRIRRGSRNSWARNQARASVALCEIPISRPQPNITLHNYRCRGNTLNISWSFVPGAEDISHYVQISKPRRIIIVQPGKNNLTVSNFTTGTNHTVQVTPAFFGCTDLSSSRRVLFTTGRGRVGSVDRVQINRNGSDVCTVKWSANSVLLQEVDSYQINITKKVIEQKPDSLIKKQLSRIITINKDKQEYEIQPLQPNTEYQVEIGTVPSAPCDRVQPIKWVQSTGGSCVTSLSVPTSITLSRNEPVIRNGVPVLTLLQTSERNGPISCYILVLIINSSESDQVVFTKEDLDSLQANNGDPNKKAYIAFVTSKISGSADVKLGDRSETCCNTRSLGSSPNCSDGSYRSRRSHSPIIRARNWELNANNKYSYYVLVSVPTANDTLYEASMTTTITIENTEGSGGFQQWLIYLIIIVAILAVILLLTIFCLYRKHLCIKDRDNSLTRSLAELQEARAGERIRHQSLASFESGYIMPLPDISGFEDFTILKQDFRTKYLNRRENENRSFRREFQKISPRNVKTTITYAKKVELSSKNRNENALPSDSNRVILRMINSNWRTDYINASYIDSNSDYRSYIAAQAPLQNTVNDFWRMIVEKNCTKIAMITRVEENSKELCKRYWPKEHKKIQFGTTLVETTSVRDFGHYKERQFVVKSKTNQDSVSLNVTQYQFIKWPENGVPLTTSSLLSFLEKIKSTPTEKPVLVHGSAGGGRTGTLLALLILIEQLKRQGNINVPRTVKLLREARTGMVANLKQYIFIYKVLCEIAILPENTCISQNQMKNQLSMMKRYNEDHVTYMRTQYNELDRISCMHDEGAMVQIAKENEAIKAYKRTALTPNPPKKKQKNPINLLNASKIEAYNPRINLITAATPTDQATNEAFWKCVLDEKVNMIVRIQESSTVIEQPRVEYENFFVMANPVEEWQGYQGKVIKMYKGKFRVKFEIARTNRTIAKPDWSLQQIDLAAWPKNGFPVNIDEVNTVADRIKNALDLESSRGSETATFKVLVHCSDGSTQSGAFCALVNILDRLKRERRVDVFRTVKDLRDCRSRMVGNIKQYEFVYTAVVKYIEGLGGYEDVDMEDDFNVYVDMP